MAEAEALQREELALSLKLLGTNHPDMAISLNNLALTLSDERNLSAAETVAREALNWRRRLLPADDPYIADSLKTLATVLLQQSNRVAAETLEREMVEIRRKHPESPGDLVEALDDLAGVFDAEHKWAEAEQTAREAVGVSAQAHPDHWLTFSATSRLGGILMHANKWTNAEPFLVDGYTGLKQRESQLQPEDRFHLFEATRRLAQFYSLTGQTEQTAKWQQALSHLETNK